MKLWNKGIIILVTFISMCGGFAAPAEAQGPPDLVLSGFTCVPSTCSDTDFGFTSFATVTVLGTCGDFLDPGLALELTISVAAVDCSFPVETEAEGTGGNQTFVDDCGDLYQLGQISVQGQIFNALTGTRLYQAIAVKDCAGGESVPPPAFSGC